MSISRTDYVNQRELGIKYLKSNYKFMRSRKVVMLCAGAIILLMASFTLNNVAFHTNVLPPVASPSNTNVPPPPGFYNPGNNNLFAYISYQGNFSQITIYEQYWAYMDPSGSFMYWIGFSHLTAGSGDVLGGGYPWWSDYASTITGTISFLNADNQTYAGTQYYYTFSPPNTISDGNAATWYFGLSASVSVPASTGGFSTNAKIGYSFNVPEFELDTASQTGTKALWNFYDNQAQGSAPNPTAVSYGAGVTVPVVAYSQQMVTSYIWGYSEHFNGWTYSIYKNGVISILYTPYVN